MGIPKKYSLKSRDSLRALFDNGKRNKAFPLHVVSNSRPGLNNVVNLKVVFSAPKRRHRTAVKRNRIKRKMREAFRPLIPELEGFVEKHKLRLDLMCIYVGTEELSVDEIAQRLKKACTRLIEDNRNERTDEQD